MSLYFKDNFFNAGRTDIMNRQGEVIGELDLKSAFGSSVDVYDAARDRVCSGSFRFFSNRWNVRDHNDQELGVLRMRMSFMKKRFEYDAGPRGTFEIISPAFSNEYEIADHAGSLAARFHRVSNWLQSGAYHLHNESEELTDWELVTVVMGIHEIRKRNNSQNHSATTH